MSVPDVVVVGEALADVVVEPGGRRRAHPGGSPANVALGLARLGHPTQLVTRIGRDAYGRMIEGHLAASGVSLSPGSVTDSPTSTATAVLDGNGSAEYVFDIVWDLPVAPDPVGPGHLHTGSIATALAPGGARVDWLVATFRSNHTVSYDPNLRPALLGPPTRERPGVERLVSLSDVVKASEEDLAWLYPGQDPDAVAGGWARCGPALVVLTRGGGGATAYWGLAGRHRLPALGVQVVDTIGAGDAFMAGLLSGLLTAGLLGGERGVLQAALRGRALHPAVAEALRLAAAAAGIACSRPGADPPTSVEARAAIAL